MPRREKEHESEQHEKESLDCPCGRCGARRLGVFGLQRPGRKGGGRTRCVVERRDAVSAPLRSDSQSGQYGEGYAAHEQQTLAAVVDARSKATSMNVDADDLTPERLAAFQQAQEGVRSALGRLIAVAENYPDLKANSNFQELQAQLEGDGESHRRSPHGLQREDAGLQRRRPPFSGQSGGGNTLVRAETLFRGGRQRCAGARSRLLIRQTTNPDSI